MTITPVWMATGTGSVPEPLLAQDQRVALWRALDGVSWRAYTRVAPPASGDIAWRALQPLLDLAGASYGEAVTHHYAVETDVSERDLDEFTAWYDTEHLPGLARVPGTIRARRFCRPQGSPRFIACYDLTTPMVLECPEWLAVRHTPWSDRVRPMFRGTVRTMFQRVLLPTP